MVSSSKKFFGRFFDEDVRCLARVDIERVDVEARSCERGH